METLTANGALSVRGGNGITDSGVITVSGTSLFNSDVTAKVITLDSVNAMTGAVSITHTGAANVAIDNGTTALKPGLRFQQVKNFFSHIGRCDFR